MEITPVARRIAKALNARTATAGPGFRLFFDADGRQTAEVYGPEPNGPRDPEDRVYEYHTYQERGPACRYHRYTAREIQDEIDDRAACAAIGYVE